MTARPVFMFSVTMSHRRSRTRALSVPTKTPGEISMSHRVT